MELKILKLLEEVDEAMKNRLINEIDLTVKLNKERELVRQSRDKVQEAITILLRAP